MRRFPLLALALAAPVFAADTAAEAPAPLNEAQATPVAAPAAAKALAKDGLVGAWTCGTSYPALSARLDEH